MSPRGRRHRRYLAGLDPEAYDALLELQGGRCALCERRPSERRRLDRDHDHATMRLRGLLCHVCNRRLGPGASPEWLRKAAAYLEEPPAARLEERAA